MENKIKLVLRILILGPFKIANLIVRFFIFLLLTSAIIFVMFPILFLSGFHHWLTTNENINDAVSDFIDMMCDTIGHLLQILDTSIPLSDLVE